MYALIPLRTDRKRSLSRAPTDAEEIRTSKGHLHCHSLGAAPESRGYVDNAWRPVRSRHGSFVNQQQQQNPPQRNHSGQHKNRTLVSQSSSAQLRIKEFYLKQKCLKACSASGDKAVLGSYWSRPHALFPTWLLYNRDVRGAGWFCMTATCTSPSANELQIVASVFPPPVFSLPVPFSPVCSVAGGCGAPFWSFLSGVLLSVWAVVSSWKMLGACWNNVRPQLKAPQKMSDFFFRKHHLIRKYVSIICELFSL